MLKKIIVVSLAIILVGAIGFSVYNASSAKTAQAPVDAVVETAQEEVAAPVDQTAAAVSEDVQPLEVAEASVAAENLISQDATVAQQGQAAQYGQSGQNGQSRGQAANQSSTDVTASADLQQSNGMGNSGSNGRGGNRWQGQNETGTGGAEAVPDPQNGLDEWVTISGAIDEFTVPTYTLYADDGSILNIELGNQNFLSSLGLYLQTGDRVTVTGYWDPNGGFSVGTLTLESMDQVFTFRDAYGRPLWSRGGRNG